MGGWGVTVAAGHLDGWCMVTVAHAHALVHGIRGTVANRLFRLYVGQEWLSPAALSMEPMRKRRRKASTGRPHSPVSVSLSALTTRGMNRPKSNLEKKMAGTNECKRPRACFIRIISFYNHVCSDSRRLRLSICEARLCRGSHRGTVRLKLVVCARIFIKFSFNASLQIPVYTIITSLITVLAQIIDLYIFPLL